jgi:hypothetical protein
MENPFRVISAIHMSNCRDHFSDSMSRKSAETRIKHLICSGRLVVRNAAKKAIQGHITPAHGAKGKKSASKHART